MGNATGTVIHDSLVYSSFVIPLINAVKELSMEIEALKSTKNML